MFVLRYVAKAGDSRSQDSILNCVLNVLTSKYVTEQSWQLHTGKWYTWGYIEGLTFPMGMKEKIGKILGNVMKIKMKYCK